MIYTHKELKDMYGSDYQIQKAVNDKKIYKLESGIYSDSEKAHYLEILVKKYPNAIITSDTAYYYHNLTDVIPRKIYIATDRNAGRIKDERIIQSYPIDTYFHLGKTEIIYEGVKINIYDRERLLVDLIKNKNQTSYDYYKEIIENYRKIKDSLDIYKIQQYASTYSNGDKIMTMIQDEVY